MWNGEWHRLLNLVKPVLATQRSEEKLHRRYLSGSKTLVLVLPNFVFKTLIASRYSLTLIVSWPLRGVLTAQLFWKFRKFKTLSPLWRTLGLDSQGRIRHMGKVQRWEQNEVLGTKWCTSVLWNLKTVLWRRTTVSCCVSPLSCGISPLSSGVSPQSNGFSPQSPLVDESSVFLYSTGYIIHFCTVLGDHSLDAGLSHYGFEEDISLSRTLSLLF